MISACTKAYLNVLAVLAIALHPQRRDSANSYLSLLLLIDFLVHFHLDVWPYATVNRSPFESPADPLTWIRLGVLSAVGFVVPFVSPRPFRPLSEDVRLIIPLYVPPNFRLTCGLFCMQDVPRLPDTVPLISRVTFSYLDKLVYHAWHVPQLTLDDLPKLSVDESTDFIRRKAFPVRLL